MAISSVNLRLIGFHEWLNHCHQSDQVKRKKKPVSVTQEALLAGLHFLNMKNVPFMSALKQDLEKFLYLLQIYGLVSVPLVS